MKCVLCAKEASVFVNKYNLCTEHYIEKVKDKDVVSIQDFIDMKLGIMTKKEVLQKRKDTFECEFEDKCRYEGISRLCDECSNNKKTKDDYFTRKKLRD